MNWIAEGLWLSGAFHHSNWNVILTWPNRSVWRLQSSAKTNWLWISDWLILLAETPSASELKPWRLDGFPLMDRRPVHAAGLHWSHGRGLESSACKQALRHPHHTGKSKVVSFTGKKWLKSKEKLMVYYIYCHKNRMECEGSKINTRNAWTNDVTQCHKDWC